MDDVKGYLDDAKKCLEKKEFCSFIEKIALAKYLSQDDSDLSLEVGIVFAEGLYKFEKYKKAYEAISELLEVSKLDDEKRSELLHKKGIILAKTGEFTESIKIFEELANMVLKKCKALGFGNLAWVYFLMYRQGQEEEYLEGYLEKAEDFGNKALTIFEAYNNPKLYKKVLINMGNIYWSYEKYSEALEIFFKVYDENDAIVLNNIASVYLSMGNLCEAEKYLEKAEMKALNQKNHYAEAHCFLVRGRISEKILEDYMGAKDNYLIAFNKFLEVNAINEGCVCLNQIFDLNALINKGNVNLLKDKLKSVLQKVFKYS